MASSLQVILPNASKPAWTLWSWDHGDFHQVARLSDKLADDIYIAHLGPIGETPSHKVVLKLKLGQGQGRRADRRLAREYEVYTGPLVHLQGSVVPRCFGLFCGDVDDSKGSGSGSGSGTVKLGKQVSCLVLEYIAPHRERAVDPEEFHRQLMLSLCKIHKAGINHGNLKTGHILQMGYSPRIIDFSLASVHSCQHGYAAAPYEADGSQSFWSTVSVLLTCEELRLAEVHHLEDIDGVVGCFQLQQEAKETPALRVLPRTVGESCDSLHPAVLPEGGDGDDVTPTLTKAPATYPPPNHGKPQRQSELRDDHVLSRNVITKRDDQTRRPTPTRPRTRAHANANSKIVFGEHYPNTSLASRRISIPSRLDLEPKFMAISGSMAVPSARVHFSDPIPPRPKAYATNVNPSSGFYRLLNLLFD